MINKVTKTLNKKVKKTKNSDKFHCHSCNQTMSKGSKYSHLKSQKHNLHAKKYEYCSRCDRHIPKFAWERHLKSKTHRNTDSVVEQTRRNIFKYLEDKKKGKFTEYFIESTYLMDTRTGNKEFQLNTRIDIENAHLKSADQIYDICVDKIESEILDKYEHAHNFVDGSINLNYHVVPKDQKAHKDHVVHEEYHNLNLIFTDSKYYNTNAMGKKSYCFKLPVLDVLSKTDRYKTYTYTKMKNEFEQLKIDFNNITPHKAIQWVKKFHAKKISIRFLDPAYELIEEHICKHPVANFMFRVLDGHTYHITNEDVKKAIRFTKQLPYSDSKLMNTRESVEINDEEEMLNRTLDEGEEAKNIKTKLNLRELVLKFIKKGMTPTCVQMKNKTYVTHFTHPVTNEFIICKKNNDCDMADKIVEKGVEAFPEFAKMIEKNNSVTTLANNLYKLINEDDIPQSFSSLECQKINISCKPGPLNQRFHKSMDHIRSELRSKNIHFNTITKPINKSKKNKKKSFKKKKDEKKPLSFFDDLKIFKVENETNKKDNDLIPVAVDMSKCYSNCLRNFSDDIPIFQSGTTWKRNKGDLELKCGEYIFNKPFKLDGVIIKAGEIYTHTFLKYIQDNKLMNDVLSNVKYYRHSTNSLDKNHFQKFVDKVFDLYDNSEAKNIINYFIGSLNTSSASYKSFVTTSLNDIFALNMAKGALDQIFYNIIEDETGKKFYLVNTEKYKINHFDRSSIWRAVITEAKIKVLEMIKRIIVPQDVLLYVKTDCIGFLTTRERFTSYSTEDDDGKTYCHLDYKNLNGSYSYRLDDFKMVNFKTVETTPCPDYDLLKCKSTTYLKDYSYDKIKKIHYINGKKVSNQKGEEYFNLLKKTNFTVIGPPGYGKSVLTKSFVNETTEILTPTNKNVSNFNQTLNVKGVEAKTLDKKFCFGDLKQKTTRVIVDEAYATNIKHYFKLYLAKLNNPDIHFIAAGDKNQTKPINDVHINLDKNPLFKFIFGTNIMIKKYIPGLSRYDQKLRTYYEYLVKFRKLHPDLKNKQFNVDDKLNVNIMKFRKRRIRDASVNSINAKKFKLVVGAKVTSNTNTRNIFNSCFYYITKIIKKNKYTFIEVKDEDGKQIMNDKFNKPDQFNLNLFEGGYASTVYRYQGSSINEPGNIRNTKYMSFQEVLTSLTRFKKASDIRIEYTNKTFEDDKVVHHAKTKTNKLRVGYIYRMRNIEAKKYYIGLTTVTCLHRFRQHKEDKNDPMHLYKGTWKVAQIAKVLFNSTHDKDVTELEAYETKYIRQYQKLCETSEYDLINKRQTKLKKQHEIKYEPQEKFEFTDQKEYLISLIKKDFKITYSEKDEYRCYISSVHLPKVIKFKNTRLYNKFKNKWKEHATKLAQEKINAFINTMKIII